MQNKDLQLVLGIVILLAISAFYFYQNPFANNGSPTATTTGQTVDLTGGINVVTEDGLIIKEVKEEDIQKEAILIMPSLDREIEFPENFPEEAHQIMIDKINTVVQDIKNNSNSYDDWISLGLQRKMLEDYEGVELAWEYAKYLEPNRFLAWSNLGDLNAYYLRNNTKAEENYLKAIELDSQQIQTYFKIVEFYTDFLSDKEKAVSVIEKGIEENPNSQQLKDLLISLK